MRVYFEALADDTAFERDAINGNSGGLKDKMLVSVIGKQKGKSLVSDASLILRLGSYSLKKLLHLEEQDILNSRFNTRLVLIACIFMF